MQSEEVKALIEAQIEGACAKVVDMRGTGDHFEAEVVAKAFEGLSPVKRHQMVYRALQSVMQGDAAPLHALKLSCKTPD